jgi:hypothetical protein
MRKTLAIFGLSLLLAVQLIWAASSHYGIVTCTTAGTAYQLAPLVSSTEANCLQVIVTADPANTGVLYLGMDSSVSSSNYFAALSVNGSFNSGPSGSSPRFPCQSLYATGSVNSTKADVLILTGN